MSEGRFAFALHGKMIICEQVGEAILGKRVEAEVVSAEVESDGNCRFSDAGSLPVHVKRFSTQ